MTLSADHILLYGSVLVIIGLLISKAGFRIGLPTLLLFLGVGMLAGEGVFGISFNDPSMTQMIGVMALTIILFSGGMDTHYKDVKPVIGIGLSLATMGVLITTLLTGTFIYYIFQYIGIGGLKLSFTQSLLCAAVMSSTDSASVFSILRTKEINLKHNIRPILELESGSNDPMAYMLTIILIQVLQTGEFIASKAIMTLLLQFLVGGVLGYSLGRLAVYVINRINLHTLSLYSILLLAFAGLTFSLTTKLSGNGYLAVYIAGLVVGNSKVIHRNSMATFFDGFAWLWQLVMFLTLGLLVSPRALWDVVIPVILIGLFLLLIGRPIAVFLSLIPFRKKLTFKCQTYISWIGLRGAVPIIFATYPWVANMEHSQLIFNIVFSITILSLIIQGSTVSWLADKLSLIIKGRRQKAFAIDLPDEIKSAVSEIIVNNKMLEHGNKLMDQPIPPHTLAVMIRRENRYFVPTGGTELIKGDHILLLSDDEEALLQTYAELGINSYSLKRNL